MKSQMMRDVGQKRECRSRRCGLRDARQKEDRSRPSDHRVHTTHQESGEGEMQQNEDGYD